MQATSSSSTPLKLHCGIGYPSQGILGSAYLEYGGSKVCVYVFCPRPMTKRESMDFDEGILECEVSLAAHLLNQAEEIYSANHHAEGVAGVLLRLSRNAVDSLSPAIRLANYPKCTIMMTAVLLNSSSDDQAALINCASAALCDAAVEMRDIVTAFALNTSQLSNHSNNKTNTSNNMNSNSNSIHCELACLSSLNEITSIEVRGKCDPSIVNQLVGAMKAECVAIRTKIAQTLTKSN